MSPFYNATQRSGAKAVTIVFAFLLSAGVYVIML